jgi:hypothetical protein
MCRKHFALCNKYRNYEEVKKERQKMSKVQSLKGEQRFFDQGI